MAGQLLGLAGVETFGLEELIETGADAVGKLVQQGGTLCQRHTSPLPLEGVLCRGHRGVHLRRTRLVNDADLLTRRRVDVIEQLAGSGADKFSIDEVLDLFHVLTVVATSKFLFHQPVGVNHRPADSLSACRFAHAMGRSWQYRIPTLKPGLATTDHQRIAVPKQDRRIPLNRTDVV